MAKYKDLTRAGEQLRDMLHEVIHKSFPENRFNSIPTITIDPRMQCAGKAWWGCIDIAKWFYVGATKLQLERLLAHEYIHTGLGLHLRSHLKLRSEMKARGYKNFSTKELHQIMGRYKERR